MKYFCISLFVLSCIMSLNAADYSRLKICSFDQQYFIRAQRTAPDPEPRVLIKQTENLLAQHVCDKACTVSEKQFRKNYELLLYKLDVDDLQEIKAYCDTLRDAVQIVSEMEEHYENPQCNVGKCLADMQSEIWSIMDEDTWDDYICNLERYIEQHAAEYGEQQEASVEVNAAKKRAFELLQLSHSNTEFWEYVEYMQGIVQRMSVTGAQRYLPHKSAWLGSISGMVQRAVTFRQHGQLGSETISDNYVWQRVPRILTVEDEG